MSAAGAVAGAARTPSASSPTTGPPDGTSVRLLATLLAAEHAAVYGYGVLGARLDDDGRRRARLARDSHRAHRDALAALLRDRGADPEPGEPAYDVAVATPAAARELAVRLEEGLAVRWRDLVAGTDDVALRATALAGLQECAVRAARWRLAAGRAAVTVAFPGVP